MKILSYIIVCLLMAVIGCLCVVAKGYAAAIVFFGGVLFSAIAVIQTVRK